LLLLYLDPFLYRGVGDFSVAPLRYHIAPQGEFCGSQSPFDASTFSLSLVRRFPVSVSRFSALIGRHRLTCTRKYFPRESLLRANPCRPLQGRDLRLVRNPEVPWPFLHADSAFAHPRCSRVYLRPPSRSSSIYPGNPKHLPKKRFDKNESPVDKLFCSYSSVLP